MPSQAERESKFIWRPNTNDSTNLTRYSQEAELWHKAFLSAQAKHKKTSLSDTIGVINLVVSLVSSLIVLILLSLIELVKWLRS
jgi:hypothetical protein